MATKTNTGLLTYARAQLGLPYWWGTFGQTATAALHSSKRAQYPSYYTASDFVSQYGKRVHDCVGLIKGYLWSETATSMPQYNSAQDVSAAGMYAKSTKKGTISSMPSKAGLLVYKGNSPSGIFHIGVYGGDGYVYEAKSHACGVVKTAFKASEWQYWSQCPYVTDDASETTTQEDDDMTEAQVMAAVTAAMDKRNPIYKTIDDVPDWGKATVQRLLDAGILKGTDSGLNLSYEMLRIFVVHDRADIYGE